MHQLKVAAAKAWQYLQEETQNLVISTLQAVIDCKGFLL